MTAIYLILLILAAVCFGIATANMPVRINMMALGLLFWVLVPLIETMQKL